MPERLKPNRFQTIKFIQIFKFKGWYFKYLITIKENLITYYTYTMHTTAKPIFLVTRNARQREQQPEASAALLAEHSRNHAFITLSEPALADTDSARAIKH